MLHRNDGQDTFGPRTSSVSCLFIQPKRMIEAAPKNNGSPIHYCGAAVKNHAKGWQTSFWKQEQCIGGLPTMTSDYIGENLSERSGKGQAVCNLFGVAIHESPSVKGESLKRAHCLYLDAASIAIKPQPRKCAFDGERIDHREVVSGYSNRKVPFGKKCRLQNFKCMDGILIGATGPRQTGYKSCKELSKKQTLAFAQVNALVSHALTASATHLLKKAERSSDVALKKSAARKAQKLSGKANRYSSVARRYASAVTEIPKSAGTTKPVPPCEVQEYAKLYPLESKAMIPIIPMADYNKRLKAGNPPKCIPMTTRKCTLEEYKRDMQDPPGPGYEYFVKWHYTFKGIPNGRCEPSLPSKCNGGNPETVKDYYQDCKIPNPISELPSFEWYVSKEDPVGKSKVACLHGYGGNKYPPHFGKVVYRNYFYDRACKDGKCLCYYGPKISRLGNPYLWHEDCTINPEELECNGPAFLETK